MEGVLYPASSSRRRCRRVAAPETDYSFNSMSSSDHRNVATQSLSLSISSQMLDAILRSSDASAFSTEDLTRLQAGISQQLSDRAHQASQQHRPVRTSQGVEPPEYIGSLIHIGWQTNHAALPTRRSLSSSLMLSRLMRLIVAQNGAFTCTCFLVWLLLVVHCVCLLASWIGYCGAPRLSLRHGHR